MSRAHFDAKTKELIRDLEETMDLAFRADEIAARVLFSVLAEFGFRVFGSPTARGDHRSSGATLNIFTLAGASVGVCHLLSETPGPEVDWVTCKPGDVHTIVVSRAQWDVMLDRSLRRAVEMVLVEGLDSDRRKGTGVYTTVDSDPGAECYLDFALLREREQIAEFTRRVVHQRCQEVVLEFAADTEARVQVGLQQWLEFHAAGRAQCEQAREAVAQMNNLVFTACHAVDILWPMQVLHTVLIVAVGIYALPPVPLAGHTPEDAALLRRLANAAFSAAGIVWQSEEVVVNTRERRRGMRKELKAAEKAWAAAKAAVVEAERRVSDRASADPQSKKLPFAAAKAAATEMSRLTKAANVAAKAADAAMDRVVMAKTAAEIAKECYTHAKALVVDAVKPEARARYDLFEQFANRISGGLCIQRGDKQIPLAAVPLQEADGELAKQLAIAMDTPTTVPRELLEGLGTGIGTDTGTDTYTVTSGDGGGSSSSSSSNSNSINNIATATTTVSVEASGVVEADVSPGMFEMWVRIWVAWRRVQDQVLESVAAVSKAASNMRKSVYLAFDKLNKLTLELGEDDVGGGDGDGGGGGGGGGGSGDAGKTGALGSPIASASASAALQAKALRVACMASSVATIFVEVSDSAKCVVQAAKTAQSRFGAPVMDSEWLATVVTVADINRPGVGLVLPGKQPGDVVEFDEEAVGKLMDCLRLVHKIEVLCPVFVERQRVPWARVVVDLRTALRACVKLLSAYCENPGQIDTATTQLTTVVHHVVQVVRVYMATCDRGLPSTWLPPGCLQSLDVIVAEAMDLCSRPWLWLASGNKDVPGGSGLTHTAVVEELWSVVGPMLAQLTKKDMCIASKVLNAEGTFGMYSGRAYLASKLAAEQHGVGVDHGFQLRTLVSEGLFRFKASVLETFPAVGEPNVSTKDKLVAVVLAKEMFEALSALCLAGCHPRNLRLGVALFVDTVLHLEVATSRTPERRSVGGAGSAVDAATPRPGRELYALVLSLCISTAGIVDSLVERGRSIPVAGVGAGAGAGAGSAARYVHHWESDTEFEKFMESMKLLSDMMVCVLGERLHAK